MQHAIATGNQVLLRVRLEVRLNLCCREVRIDRVLENASGLAVMEWVTRGLEE